MELTPITYIEPTQALDDFDVKYASFIEPYEIHPAQLKKSDKKLGEGNYGDVWLANLYPFGDHDNSCGFLSSTLLKQRLAETGAEFLPIAMKTVKDECLHPLSRKKQRTAIRAEINVLCQLGQHDNVLTLLAAITTNQNDFCMVTEFCELGSLDKYLLGKQKEARFINEIVPHQIQERTPLNTLGRSCTYSYMAEMNGSWINSKAELRHVGHVTTSDLLSFANQVADGMQYLHSKNIIHRDLALRNVLLKSNMCVKIADFGLSRLLTDNGIYHQNSDDHIPAKWTAPEVFLTKNADIHSDYWTFGLTMHEQFSFITEGNRLELPAHSPGNIYDVMLKLWHIKPETRLNLEECKLIIADEFRRSMSTLAERKGDYPVSVASEEVFMSSNLKSKLDELAHISQAQQTKRNMVLILRDLAMLMILAAMIAIMMGTVQLLDSKQL